MRSVLSIGPVGIRLSWKGCSPWGYAAIRIGGLSMFSRSSNGSMIIASYHPSDSLTWVWSVSVGKRNGNRMICRAQAPMRRGQWHDFYNLGRLGLCIGRQNYHRK